MHVGDENSSHRNGPMKPWTGRQRSYRDRRTASMPAKAAVTAKNMAK
jgi:hypothetical protein